MSGLTPDEFREALLRYIGMMRVRRIRNIFVLEYKKNTPCFTAAKPQRVPASGGRFGAYTFSFPIRRTPINLTPSKVPASRVKLGVSFLYENKKA
jgi:hypothetical protein